MSMQASASNTALLLLCQRPFDPSLEFEREEAGEAARYGTAFHSLIAWLLLNNGSKKGWDRQVDATLKNARLSPSAKGELPGHVRGSWQVLDSWLRGKNPWGRDFFKGQGTVRKPKLEVEKSYAINLSGTILTDHVREISNPTEEEHRYEDLAPSGELAGTADLILNDLVIDHKTGMSETFTEPAEKAQLKSLGLVPFLRSGQRPIVGVLHSPRLGLPVVYADEVQSDEISKHREALRGSLARIGDGSLRPGPWCERCPAREACPAQHGELLKRTGDLVRESMGIPEFLAGDDQSRKIIPSEQVGKLHLLAGQLETALKVLRQEIRARVEDGDLITRPDRKTLALVERSFERLSKRSFEEALGKIKAEKEFVRLRKLGVLVKETRQELHAVWPD